MNRRGFLAGLLASPAVITTPGLLMPVKAWGELNPDFQRLWDVYEFSHSGVTFSVGGSVHYMIVSAGGGEGGVWNAPRP